MPVPVRVRGGPRSRRLLVRRVLDQEWSASAAAEAAGCSERTVYKWIARYRVEGEAVGKRTRNNASNSQVTPAQRRKTRRTKGKATSGFEPLYTALQAVA